MLSAIRFFITNADCFEHLNATEWVKSYSCKWYVDCSDALGKVLLHRRAKKCGIDYSFTGNKLFQHANMKY